MKVPVCCGRKQGKLTMEEANLARLARRAARQSAAGHDITKLQEAIDESKERIDEAKKQLVDHEAEHAGDPR